MARKIIRSATAAAVALVGVVSLAGAQAQRGPNPNAPRLMVSACRTADKALATQCADKLRSQVEGDLNKSATVERKPAARSGQPMLPPRPVEP